ncbi:hypothetical protein TNCV_2515911 [Trichonephila clavipes]|nr:hypothetical protein TNCV_2515911 [Trichonephila clavipes]
MHRCPTWWVFSGTGIELVTRQATIRYLYHSATAARDDDGSQHCPIRGLNLGPVVWKRDALTTQPPDLKLVSYLKLLIQSIKHLSTFDPMRKDMSDLS